jgi:aldehyde:ferredoxin oxidoreductase
MAWAGKILRVNLTAGACKAEPLNGSGRDYVGQRRLATKYFVEEVDAKVAAIFAALS